MENYRYAKRLEGVSLISAAYSKADTDLIPLSFGYPSPDSFPINALSHASQKALMLGGDKALQYSGGEGKIKLAEWIKDRVKQIDINVKIDSVLVTTGSGQAIDLITRALANPGDEIWIEAPSYFGAIRSFQLAELKIKSFNVDNDGIDVDKVESELFTARRNGSSIPKLMYIIPNYQNPKGVSLSVERRKKLAELAREFNFFIIEDDAYGELDFNNKKVPSLYSFCPERVIYIGSFSKIFGPGLRIGWIITEPEVLTQIRTLKSDGNTSVFVQEIMHHMLESIDITEHLKTINTMYKKRRDIMVDEIKKQFKDEVSFNIPKGGFFIWLTFPENVITNEVLEEAKKNYQVDFFTSNQFYVDKKEENHIRLSFAYCDEQEIMRGISSIADAYFSVYKKDFDLGLR